jgi:hypothetical protein
VAAAVVEVIAVTDAAGAAAGPQGVGVETRRWRLPHQSSLSRIRRWRPQTMSGGHGAQGGCIHRRLVAKHFARRLSLRSSWRMR